MPEKACLRRQSPRRSNAGIFWVNSGPLNTTLLPYPDYVKWYEGIHIPDWMGAKKDAISTGWRFQCEDEDRKQPFLVVYRYANISDTNAPEFRSVPLGHPSLPGGGPIPRLANFAAISGQNTEAWRSARIGADDAQRGPVLVSEGIDPGSNTERFHDWYRKTYIVEVSHLKGWRRTSRFRNDMGGKTKWLALHEFDEGSLAEPLKGSLLGTSQEVLEMQRSFPFVDIAKFKLTRVYGDKTNSWVRVEEEVIST